MHMKDKGTAHTQQAAAAGTEIFSQAMKSYEQALRTGVKLQEDTAKWLTSFCQQPPWTHELQKQMGSVVSQTIPAIQRNMEESLRLIDMVNKTTLNLLKKSTNGSSPAAAAAAEVQPEMQRLWQSSLSVMQSNMKSLTDTQTKAVESWTEFMRKGVASAAAAASAK
jgi:hypothetical protein